MLGIFPAGIHLSATILDILPCKLIRHSFYCDREKSLLHPCQCVVHVYLNYPGKDQVSSICLMVAARIYRNKNEHWKVM